MNSDKLNAIRQAFEQRKRANAAIVASKTETDYEAAKALREKADAQLRTLGVGNTRTAK
jgi:hypothetical protein